MSLSGQLAWLKRVWRGRNLRENFSLKNDLLVLSRQEYPSGLFAPFKCRNMYWQCAEVEQKQGEHGMDRGGVREVCFPTHGCMCWSWPYKDKRCYWGTAGRELGVHGENSFFGCVMYRQFCFLKIVITLFRKTWLQIATITTRSGFLGYAYLRLQYE